MSNRCSECDLQDLKVIERCDSCKKILCRKCSELTETELRCIAIKNRRLAFLCNDCGQSLKIVPEVLMKLEELQNQILSMQENTAQQQTQKETNQIEDIEERENVIAELMERQRRASNIISNVKESLEKTSNKRLDEDKNKVTDILKNFEIDLSRIKIFRLGKHLPNKNRLIKVIFDDTNDAMTVLRNKAKIVVPSVRVFADQITTE